LLVEQEGFQSLW